MPPIPCAHCGNNFMRTTLDPEAPKLCNNCSVKEEKRNPKPKEKMSTIDILIKCPREVQIEIEEYCITHGMDFNRYFLELHARRNALDSLKKENNEYREVHLKIDGTSPVNDAYFKVEEVKTENNKSAKKSSKK